MKHFFGRFCSYLIGIVFCLSALFKLMDPVGTSLIVEAYLKFFHIDFLSPAAKVIGECISFIEAICGIGLLSGVWKTIFGCLTIILTIFFTVISVLLLIFNPEMECGCFGEVIHLTHFQTFIKNAALLALCAVAFLPIRELQLYSSRRYPSFFLGLALVITFSVLSWRWVPLADFTVYRPSHTIVPEGDPMQGPDNPALHLWDSYGNDCSMNILSGKNVLISFYDINDVSVKQRNLLASFAQDAYNAGMTPYVIAAGEYELPGVESYLCDYKDVITLNRSNGGLTFIDDGYIYHKTNVNDMPSYDILSKAVAGDSTEQFVILATGMSVWLQSFILVFLVITLLI